MFKQLQRFRLGCLASCLALFTAHASFAQTITEGFETGLPATAPTTAQNYILSSGTWTIFKGQSATKAHTGSVALQLNAGSNTVPTYGAAPAVNAPSTVTFWAVGSAKGKLKVQKSINGAAYVDVATLTITTSYASYSVAVNEANANVRIRFANSGTALMYVDDATINGAPPPNPVITTSVTSLADFGNVNVGATSAEQTYSLSASGLTPLSGNLTVAAPAGFEVSLTSGSGFASSISVAYSGGALAATTIHVHFKPTAAQAYSGSITNSGGGAATISVAVSGTGVNPPPATSNAKFVSPTGNDVNPGTIDAPFLTITKAVSVANAGDTIYLRGGRHFYTTTISISKSGTSTSKFYLLAYGNEKPILDFSGMAVSSSNRGINMSGSYWYFKGIDFYKAGDNGMFISGAFNIVELCNFYENSDTGLQLGNGANNNQIINCDSYYNADPTQGNADGFAAKLDVGTGNSFKGCRSWQNSDDGWDGLLNVGLGQNPSTTYDNCWCFMNGYLKDGSVAANGNGNGFKTGGNQERHDATLTNCLSAFNKAKGFDQNNNTGSMILYNCTGYKNGGPAVKPNFGFGNIDPATGEVMIIKNCISYLGGAADVFRAVAQLSNNSWQNGIVVNDADFVSVDSIGLRNARKADGSLPDINFMHLTTGSDMIDAGVNVGLPYNGAAPDLGCFETGATGPVTIRSQQTKPTPVVNDKSTVFVSNINPVTAYTTLRFQIPATTRVHIRIVNLAGQTVKVLFNGTAQGGNLYSLPFEKGSLRSAAYLAVMETAAERKYLKLVVQ